MESRGFQGSFYFVAETTPGTTVTNPAYKRLGNVVSSVKVSLDTKKEGFRSIDSLDVVDFLKKTDDIVIETTHVLQRVDPLDVTTVRAADGTTTSYQCEIGSNTASTTKAYYTLNYVRAEKPEVKVDGDGYVIVTMRWRCKLIVAATAAPSVGSGSREAALNTTTYPYLSWKGASVTKGGSAWGAIVSGFSFAVDNKTEVPAGLGSYSPGGVFDGAHDIQGKGDIYIDDGAYNLFQDVNGDANASIVFNTGPTGSPKFTLTGCEFARFELALDDKAAIIKTGVPFMAKSVTVGTV